MALSSSWRCLVNRGTMGVNSLPKTVTRQRRGCDLHPGPFCAWVQHANPSATEPPRKTLIDQKIEVSGKGASVGSRGRPAVLRTWRQFYELVDWRRIAVQVYRNTGDVRSTRASQVGLLTLWRCRDWCIAAAYSPADARRRPAYIDAAPATPFIPGLKPSFSATASDCSLPFLLPDWLHGFPGLFADTSEHVGLLIFGFSVFLFLIVVSVR